MAIDLQDYRFLEWNRTMRLKLEAYFRCTAVITIAYIAQGAIVIGCSFGSLKKYLYL